jgi:hypothetical protein
MIKHRLKIVEGKIKPKGPPEKPTLVIVHHTHDDGMTQEEFDESMKDLDAKVKAMGGAPGAVVMIMPRPGDPPREPPQKTCAQENADYEARMKERKPEDAARDLIINVVHTKKSGLGLKPEPEPSDEELEAEIARLEAELKGKAKQ